MKPLYKTILLLFLNVLFLVFNSFSQQAPGIEWQNTIGGNNTDEDAFTMPTSDGGYITGGTSFSSISGDKTEMNNGILDLWIVKTNSLGNIQWQNTIGGSKSDWLLYIAETADGGYILGGGSESNISGDKTEDAWNNTYDYWLIKTDNAGNLLWQNTIGGNWEDFMFSMQQTSDGGYILGGYSASDISGDKTENNIGPASTLDYWMVKTDSLGNVQWDNTIGGSDDDMIFSIQQTTDGGYILGGESRSDSSGDKTENNWDVSDSTADYWLVKTDSIGTVQWQNTIGGTNNERLNSVLQTPDGGYLLAGFSLSGISGDKTENSNGSYDYWIVKTDNAGNIQWQDAIGGSGTDYLISAQQTPDGGYVFGGYSNSNISGDKTENCKGQMDYWIVKTDSTTNIQWQKTIGGSDTDALTSVKQTPDGGYILSGYSLSDISGDKTENTINNSFDYWIVKLFPDTVTSISNLQIPNSNLLIFPNPSSGIFQITFPSSSNQKTNYTLEVINILGQTVFASQPETRNQKPETTIDVSFLPKGMYVLRLGVPSGKINDNTTMLNSKLIIE